MATPVYELFYWPKIPGRGEIIRLALEAGQADYVDHANEEQSAQSVMPLISQSTQGKGDNPPPLAPPILKHGDLWLSQSTNILLYLGPRLGLTPEDEAGRLHVNQLQLTLSDLLNEVHDVHHPMASSLYYEDQKPEAFRRAKNFREERVPKYLSYFERVISSRGWLVGDRLTYADLSLFQNIEGLRFAFPRLMAGIEHSFPKVMAIHDKVSKLPVLQAYLARRVPFGNGIFRHYDELDEPLA